MIAFAVYAGSRPQAATLAMTADIVLGFVLLFWYVRE
jgi:hypothetical protein